MDGVTEGARADGGQWGEERLILALTATWAMPCAETAAVMTRAVRAFEGETGATEEVTLVVGRRC